MNQVDPMATSFASITPYNYSFNDPVTFTDPSGAKPENEFDDLYGGCLTCYYNNGGDFGTSSIMDPVGGGVWSPGYGVAMGFNGGQSLAGIISSYNPDYGGPVYVNVPGNGGRWVSPSLASWAVDQFRAPTEGELGEIGKALGLDLMSSAGTEAYFTVNLSNAVYSTMHGRLFDSHFATAVIGFGRADYLKMYAEISATRLRSNFVKINSSPGADNSINPALANYFSQVMEKAASKGIVSVNISSTTNHPTNSNDSAHSIKNGSKAFDISIINGVVVSIDNPYSSKMQKIIQETPGWRENYGPSFVEKMINGVSTEMDRNRVGPHQYHIHVATPRK